MFAISVEPVEIVGFGVRLVLNFVTETRAVRSSLQSFERYSGYLLGDTDDRVQRVQVPIFRVLGVLRIVDTFGFGYINVKLPTLLEDNRRNNDVILF